MKFKGEYASDTSYDVGDAVGFGDAGYVLKKACPAGTPPTVDRCWSRLDQKLWDVVDMVMDAMDNAMAVINSRITEESIALKTDTADYIITVDDSGETPELVVDAIEDDSDDGNEEAES